MRSWLVVALGVIGCAGELPPEPRPPVPRPAAAHYEAPGLTVEVRCEQVDVEADPVRVVLRVRLSNRSEERVAVKAHLRAMGELVPPDEFESEGMAIAPWTTQDARLVFLVPAAPPELRLEWKVFARGLELAADATAFAPEGGEWRVGTAPPRATAHARRD
jgi:hypothetical protein